MSDQIFEDGGEILKLVMSDGNDIEVDSRGVTRIEPYLERGEMGYVTWFTIWNNEYEIGRANSKYVLRIYYAG